MFELDPDLTYVNTVPDHVFDIYTSINRPTVAPPGRTPEPAQSYVATVFNQGKYDVFIYLYMSASNQGLLYRWSEGPVPGDRVPELYQSAIEFNESMGFMMDDLHYRDKSPQEKEQAFAEIPMFHADLSFMKSESGEEDSEELVIESIEEDPVEEPAAEEAVEINLDVLGEREDLTPEPEPAAEEVTEINLDDSEVMLEKQAPGQEPPLASPEPEAEEELEEELSLDESLDEQTIEAAPPLEAVIEKEPPAADPEDLLTSEEEEVLGALDDESAPAAEEMTAEEEPGEEIEEIMIETPPPAAPKLKSAPRPAAPEPEVPPPLEEEPAPPPKKAKPPAPPPVAAAPAPDPRGAELEELEDRDYEMIVRFLAML